MSVKSQNTLKAKSQELMNLLQNSDIPILHLDLNQFEYYVKSPKNYSIILMFTILDSQDCKICSEIYKEYKILAKSWKKCDLYSNKIFFMIADFKKAPGIFEDMKLKSVPLLVYWPSKKKKSSMETYPIEKLGIEAERMSLWVYSKTNIQIRIVRPVNYQNLLMILGAVLLVLSIGYWQRNRLSFLLSRYVCATLALAFVYIMISGQMWNRIRSPPFMHQNHKTGQMTYIAPGGSSQFVAETYIVIALNAAITLGIIMVQEASIPRKRINKNVRKVIAVVGLLLLSIFFSQLLSIFRHKYGNYPYSFLFK
ncbi:unnamed protein product [Gordionus sp. m RMFG-2023]|uniref:magnesium transporter protein 1-like n=1 Tax=Gordionus sp. m RMFG-2023 TaxID=3053472 RepID=UPI0030DF4D4D